MAEISVVINNAAGLHARPATLFVQKAAAFQSKVTISGNGKTGDGKSILQIMAMGLRQGQEMLITAQGPDEIECIAALQDMVEKNFGE